MHVHLIYLQLQRQERSISELAKRSFTGVPKLEYLKPFMDTRYLLSLSLRERDAFTQLIEAVFSVGIQVPMLS